MGSHRKLHYIFILLGSMALMLSSAAYATPNILGTYEGTITISEFNCGTGAPGNLPLFPNSTSTDPLTLLTISSQSGTSFNGSGSSVDTIDGSITNVTFSDTVDDFGNVINGSFSTSASDGFTSSGIFSGTILITSVQCPDSSFRARPERFELPTPWFVDKYPIS